MESALRSQLLFTRADYDALPEGLRVELIDGELLKMAPPTIRHQKIAKRVFAALVEAVGLDRVFFCPVDVPVNDHNAVQPDVVVVPEGSIPKDAAKGIRRPLCVVEVLSPSTAGRDRLVKTRLYFSIGAEEVWLLDTDAETAEVRTPDGARTFRRTLRSKAIPGFALPLGPVFKRE